MGEPRRHPIELVRDGQRRRWPWLLVALLILFACAVSVGLPGSGQLRITVRHAGGPGVVSGNAASEAGGDQVEIQQVGRTVRRLTVPGLGRTVRLRPGVYQVIVTNVPGCGGSGFVLWGTLQHVDIVCSVK